MLNLAKVLCLLLAAKATSAGLLGSLDSALKSFDEAMKSSLQKMEKSYAKNAGCVRAANSSLRLAIDDLEDKCKHHPSQSTLFGHTDSVVVAAKKRIALIDNIRESLDQMFKAESGLLKDQQILADVCISSHPDSRSGRRQAASCINKVRKTFPEKVKKAKLDFSQQCEEAKSIVETALMHLKVCTSSQ